MTKMNEGQRLVSEGSDLVRGSNCHWGGGRGGGGWEVSDNQFPTFVAESKSAKIPKSHYGGGKGLATTNFQLLLLSANLLKFQSSISWGGGGGGW